MTAAELKLKQAAEDIKDILRKYDIAASLTLHTPGHAEYVNHLLTSYSCAYQYKDDSIRLYSKKEDFESKEAQLKSQAETANMLRMLLESTGKNFLMLEPISKKFDELVNAEHTEPKPEHQ